MDDNFFLLDVTLRCVLIYIILTVDLEIFQGMCGTVTGHWIVDFYEPSCVTRWRGFDNKVLFDIFSTLYDMANDFNRAAPNGENACVSMHSCSWSL